jgi:tRNA dimethylallyltransferase
MLNILNSRTNFSAAQFKKKAQKIIADILKRKKLPIICGGTGFWIKALVDNVDFPEVKPDFELRKELEKETAKKLFLILKKLDSRRAKNIDKNNKVRLIRAIEICKTLGKVPTPKDMRHNMQNTKYDFLQIGIQIPREKLNERIKMRLKKRFNQNMVQEIAQLHREGISWKRLEVFGLEYRWIARFLQNKISRKEMEEKLYLDIIHYAKRQMTWFQKDKRIEWIKNQKEAAELIEKFLNL